MSEKFRVRRNRDYTVMSNIHLRDDSISLKAKGLLSQMLSLPDDWDYTLRGLSRINRENTDAIRAAIGELERVGYVRRERRRDDHGRLMGMDYVIYERPPNKREPDERATKDAPKTDGCADESGTEHCAFDAISEEKDERPETDSPENVETKPFPPASDFPTLDNPTLEKPALENPTQQNIYIQNTDSINTDLQKTSSLPFVSEYPGDRARTERKRTESDVEAYRARIRANISHGILADFYRSEKRYSRADRLDEIAELILETVLTAKKTIRVAGDEYPAGFVRDRFLKLNCSHVEFALDCLENNTTKIRNVRKYLLAVLFNAPTTISGYYESLVNCDRAAGKLDDVYAAIAAARKERPPPAGEIPRRYDAKPQIFKEKQREETK